MSTSFAERVALVIGGTGGIGAATARAFSNKGARVLVGGRRADAGKVVVDDIVRNGGVAEFCYVDVCDSLSIEKLIAFCDDRWGRLDFAFNNAGWEGTAQDTAHIEEADWQRMIDVKLNGLWRSLKQELVYMSQQERGAIVNMAGSWGLTGFPQFSSYCAAAHGVVGLTRASAMEYAPKGIRVNAVCPGAVDAPMLDRMVGGDESLKDSFGSSLPLGRIAKPDEVAAAIVWLCSDESSYVTGHALPLTGGV